MPANFKDNKFYEKKLMVDRKVKKPLRDRVFAFFPHIKSKFSDFDAATHLAVSIASMAFIENKKYITNSCSVKNFKRLVLKCLRNEYYLNLLSFICAFIHYI